MRILYVADRLSGRGGADLHLLEIVRWAVGRGWIVDLAVGRIESGAPVPPGVDLVRVKALGSRTALATGLEALDGLLNRVDLVHVQNVVNPEALGRLVASGKAVVTVQDHRFFCPGMGKTLPDGSRCTVPMGETDCSVCLEDPGYRHAIEALTARRLEALHGARLIVLSRYMRDELAAVGFDHVAIVPPWIEPGPGPTDPGGYFLLTGRLVRHKGVLDAFDAWRGAGMPLKLLVAGDGPLIGDLEGADRHGWLEHEEYLGLIGGARALLFPSSWQEPFGIAGIEALARGVPVIAVVRGGMEDWVEAGCLRVEPGDTSGLRDAVRKLAGHPDFARRLGEEGRRFVGETFDPRRIQRRLFDVYREVIGNDSENSGSCAAGPVIGSCYHSP